MGCLPSSGSGLTSEFPGVIKRLLFESQLNRQWERKNYDTERVIWAIRGVKFPVDKRQSCVCVHGLHTYKHTVITHRDTFTKIDIDNRKYISENV